ncbi:hypothetical protein [Streptomyces sp. NBC_01207]|uniref:hypothetical protein n=1 Tax=Streptomyces sp. NBC_01207 TaxID=2903772 RepID=UPI002E145F53|nr:hypothetical protein OG457_27295 [Streptomyces sp. NBC_01207]
MKLPAVLAGLWETPDDDEATEPEAAPAATTAAGPSPAPTPVNVPPKPTQPPAPFIPTYNGRPIPAGPIGGARLPLPGQTVNLDPNAPTPPPAPATAPAATSPDWWSTKARTAATAAATPVWKDPAGAAPDEDDADGEDGEEKPTATDKARRWAAALPGRGREWAKEHALRTVRPISGAREARMSILDRIRAGGGRVNRWGFWFNAAALALGTYWGITGWMYDCTGAMDLEADAWHDFGPMSTFVLYGLVLVVDNWASRRILPIALLGRVPTICCAVGALLYGGTEAVTTVF